MKHFISLVIKKILSFIKWIFIGQILTAFIFMLVSSYTYLKLDQEPFEAYVVYSSVIPAQSIFFEGDFFVAPGSLSFVQSNFEILKVPKTGLKLTWEEILECDRNPYDVHTKYNPHATISPTSRTYTKTKVVKSIPQGKGWKLIDIHGNQVKFPKVDSNCRMEINITQKHKWGIVKIITFYSELIYVRDLYGKYND